MLVLGNPGRTGSYPTSKRIFEFIPNKYSLSLQPNNNGSLVKNVHLLASNVVVFLPHLVSNILPCKFCLNLTLCKSASVKNG